MSLKEKELYEFGQFRLDVAERFLVRSDGGERLQLSEKSFETLCILVRSAGHLVRKEELMNQVWGDSFVEENNLDKCIYAIRRALDEKPGAQKFVETVRKHGYRFVAPVRRVETEAEPLNEENTFHSGTKQFPVQNSPQRGEPPERQNKSTVIALADWRREADQIETVEQKISPSTSAGQIVAAESVFAASIDKNSENEAKPDHLPKITKRRKGLIRGLKFLLCGLIVGFVFLIFQRGLMIFGILLSESKSRLPPGASGQLGNMIVNLLTLLYIPIVLGFFFGIGLFLFGNARIIYALFERAGSKINSLLVERLIAGIIILTILAIVIPNLMFSYRQGNKAGQSRTTTGGDNITPPVFQSIQASRLTDNGTASLAEISPDGRFVAFVNRQNGMESLAVRQVVTDNIVVIVQPTAMTFTQPSFTPDGNFIYYVQFDNDVGTLFQIPALGGESKKIIADVDSPVTFSPDGKRIAFIRHDPFKGGYAIIIANHDGTNPEPFLQTNEIDYDQFFHHIDWSPENDKILVGVFKHKAEPNQKWQIATVRLDDKKLELIDEKGWNEVGNFEWLRNGASIVLAGKANSGENSQIWHLSYPNGERRQITTDTSDYSSVSVSADESLMMTTRVDTLSSLWSRVPQTGEIRQLIAENKNMLGLGGISQTPDGKILFVKNRNNEINIFSIEETGAGEKQLTTGNGINLCPLATSDGKYIVFNTQRTGIYFIWRMNTDGSNAVQLTTGQNAIDSQPQITKDGRNVVFVRGTNDYGKMKLMKVSIDGGDAVPLMPGNMMVQVFPQISTDGKFLAYITHEFNANSPNIEPKIRVVGFDGEKIDKTVTEIKTDDFLEFKFSPDNKSLTYVKKGGIDNLWSLSLNDHKEKPLTDFTSGNISNFVWSTDGRKLFIIRAIYNSDLVLIKDDAKDNGGKNE